MASALNQLTRLLIITTLGLSFSFDKVLSEDSSSPGLRYEQEIRDYLTLRLEGLIPQDRYKLLVSVNARQERIKEQIEGETQSKGDRREEKALPQALPGFQLLETKRNDTKVEKEERSRFAFRTQTTLDQVNVRLILDQSLEQNRKTLVEDIVTTSIKNTYGSAGVVETLELDFSNSALPLSQRVSEWFSSYLGLRFGSAIDFAYLLALLLILVLVAMTLGRRLLMAARRNANTPPKDKNPKDLLSKDQQLADQMINQIIDAYVRGPMEVRRFLSLLPDKDKGTFLSAIRAPALRGYFESILERLAPTDQDFNKAARERFASIAQDLERYLTIQKEQIKHPYGFLETFDKHHLKAFVQQQLDSVKCVAIMSPFLRKDQYADLSEDWSIEEKVRLFKWVHEASFASEEIADLEIKLRQRYQEIREKGIVRMRNHLQVEREILESDAEVNEILAALARENYDLPLEYQKYRVTFDEFIGLDQVLIKNVLRAVPNEVIAKALVKYPQSTATWSKLLGEVRFKLIDSIRSRFVGIDTEQVRQAQFEILRAYRSLV